MNRSNTDRPWLAIDHQLRTALSFIVTIRQHSAENHNLLTVVILALLQFLLVLDSVFGPRWLEVREAGEFTSLLTGRKSGPITRTEAAEGFSFARQIANGLAVCRLLLASHFLVTGSDAKTIRKRKNESLVYNACTKWRSGSIGRSRTLRLACSRICFRRVRVVGVAG